MHITANLFSALQHLRHVSENRVLWADAVCINQEDVDKKTVQVALMGTIYSTCTRVLIWLGEAAQESGRALAGLADLGLSVS
ncbi:heterokaryon incompatibility [Cladorrhinum sp. PSN259]|nr:heterokaryon incompatibility [Cladorrhinum sp. PSN259]